MFELAKPDHPAAIFIPQTEFQGLQTGTQGDRLDLVEDGIFLLAFFEVIVGNPRAEMVQVVESDIPAEPLQQFWKVIVGTSINAG
jgi:hypothetical protein